MPKMMHEELPELLLGRLRPESRQALQSATAQVAPDDQALQGIFLGALLAPDANQARAQLVRLAPLLGAALTTCAQRERGRLDQLPAFVRLPTLAALLPRLARLTDRDRARLVKITRAFLTQIRAHEVLRFAAARLILQQLAAPATSRSGYLGVEEAGGSCALLCTWMASLHAESAQKAYRLGLEGLLAANRRPAYNPAGLAAAAIDVALAEAQRLPPVGKRALSDALLRIIGADQSMDAPEFDLLRFISLRLGVAIPSVPLAIRSDENAA